MTNLSFLYTFIDSRSYRYIISLLKSSKIVNKCILQNNYSALLLLPCVLLVFLVYLNQLLILLQYIILKNQYEMNIPIFPGYNTVVYSFFEYVYDFVLPNYNKLFWICIIKFILDTKMNKRSFLCKHILK